jgi:hypothetical protein
MGSLLASFFDKNFLFRGGGVRKMVLRVNGIHDKRVQRLLFEMLHSEGNGQEQDREVRLVANLAWKWPGKESPSTRG